MEDGYTCTGEPSVCARVHASEEAGDANCDGRVTAGDLIRVQRLFAKAERASCGQDDANRDGKLDDKDLSATILKLFGAD